MNVKELSGEQLHQLKCSYLTELDDAGKLKEKTGLDAVSYGVLANVDDFVSDETVFAAYADTYFVEDDFG